MGRLSLHVVAPGGMLLEGISSMAEGRPDVGVPGGTENYTTIMKLEADGDIDPGLYMASVEIAEGQPQRSSIKQIRILFSRDVTVVKDNIKLVGTTTGTVIDTNNVDFDYSSTTQWLTLFFPPRYWMTPMSCCSIAMLLWM
jgi:hypothetical protein